MTTPHATLKSLSTLVTLREDAVDRLTAELAAKERERERYRHNLERMAALCAGGSGASVPALALNSGHYKQAVLQMADAHRTDLALHEADMAVTRRALVAASVKHEVMGQVLAQQRQRVHAAQQRVEQKRQDELATQAWGRAKS